MIEKRKKIKRSIDITHEKMEQLNIISSKRNIPTSVLIREFIDKGISIEKTKDDIAFIRKQIREELETVIGKEMSRVIIVN